MFFEDLPVGHRIETGRKVLTADAIKTFAAEWDPQPFHLDEEAAKASPYGALIASGFHTILTGFTLALAASDWSRSSMGSPGMENVRWIKPVFAGDELHVIVESLSATPSKSKPDRGFVVLRYDIFNQDEVLVSQFTSTLMLARRVSG